MKIDSLVIDGIGGIKHLELKFNPGVNVLCGANGIGKSTVLDTISDVFTSGISSKLKRNALCECGNYSINVSLNENGATISRKTQIEVRDFQPDKEEYRHGWEKYATNILYFGINRNMDYIRLNAITSDPSREGSFTLGKLTKNGVGADDIKNWFVNRYLFSDKEGSLTEEQRQNYELAETVFGILDNSVKFKKVIASTYDIMLSTEKGEIYFEYLSSGYKSCIYIILGIIKEIEYRTSESPVQANKFDGVVLIDEIDLHLHPIWQSQLIGALKTIFPCVQFILTTHSPSVLQCLEKDEIIALACGEDGNTCLKELNMGRFGLQGWTLEEILVHVMGMPATTSSLYRETLANFDKAMNDEDRTAILQQYELLKEMLHPDNPLRKLLAIQVAEWED